MFYVPAGLFFFLGAFLYHLPGSLYPACSKGYGKGYDDTTEQYGESPGKNYF